MPSPRHDTDAAARRPGPLDPATAAIRSAVRQAISPASGGVVLAAVSGGADSLALAAALGFEAGRLDIRPHAVIVDHGLQEASAEVAARAAEQSAGFGLETHVVRVEVGDAGGPEAAARSARYAAIDDVAARIGAELVLLGHTLDDQAETVLLGLARGSGSGSLQGMPPLAGRHARPLLGIRRAQTRASCAARGIEPWNDPHNADPSYTRVRVRQRVLPVLEAELGPGVAEALTRTAEQAREDTEAFQDMIDEFIEEICEPAEAGISVEAASLAANPAALRNRVIRYVAEAEFGVSLSRTHTLSIAALVTDWSGQGPIDVPGVSVRRAAGRIVFTASPA